MLSEFKHCVQEPGMQIFAAPSGAEATPEIPLPLISLNQVSKSFPLAVGEYRALEDVNLQLPMGRLIAITGSSGSGKSTLLNLIAGLDRPSNGELVVAGTRLSTLNESELASFRGAKIGVVFQFFQLLPTLTALENLLLAMDLVKVIEPSQRRSRALGLLASVGVADQADKFPAALSGGQQQRVAIARALANDPPLLVADEPTGNLDSQSAHAVFRLLKELTLAGKTVLVVTHEREFPVRVDGVIELRDGRVVRQVDGADVQAARTV
jgi:putative ABC transport system ATP-binding protein